jgi:hypothetical protein
MALSRSTGGDSLSPESPDLGQFPYIDKHFGNLIRQDMRSKQSRHPLSRQLLAGNRDYLCGIDLILRSLERKTGFSAIIDDMKSDGFYDNLSTLQFCELLEKSGNRVDQIIGSKGDTKKPDIAFKLSGHNAYAECKHIIDSDALTGALVEHFRNVDSHFVVSIRATSTTYYQSSIQRVIDEIEQSIRRKESDNRFSMEQFEIPNLVEYSVDAKRSMKQGPTPVAIVSSWTGITPSMFREKIEDLMNQAAEKMKPLSDSCNYLFIKSDLKKLDSDDISCLLYGSTETTVPFEAKKYLSPLGRFEKAIQNGFLDLLINERMLPSLTRNKLDGLFLNEVYDILSSVVFVDFMDRVYEYRNPFVQGNKIAGNLFRVAPCFPLSTSWLRSKNLADAK